MIHLVFLGGVVVALVTLLVTFWLVLAQRTARHRGNRRIMFSDDMGTAETIMTSDD